MSLPDSSPVRTAVEFFSRFGEADQEFRKQYHRRDHARLRSKVWEAAADEAESKHWEGIPYEPLDDVRVRWMLDWCDVIAGTKRHVDDRLQSSLEFMLQRGCPISGKALAAGEPPTLAQGS